MIIKKISIYSILKYFFILLVSFSIIYPMLNILAVSLSDSVAIMKNEITFYPKGINFSAYRIVFSDEALLLSYWNTIKYVVLGTFIAMFVTTCGAYALSKGKKLFGYKFFTIMILITMFFNGGLIPEYLTMKMLGLLDTTWIIVLIGAVSAWNLIVMRTFFTSISADLQDSGRIDGLNDYGILLYIVLPLSSAILATVSLFYAVSLWNSYFTPYIYLKNTKKYPIQILLKQLLIAGTNKSQEAAMGMGDSLIMGQSLVNATIIVSIIPIIVIYPFLQKYFVKGIMIGSLKE
mgnify:CR=1 FL=1